MKNMIYTAMDAPKKDCSLQPVILSDLTMAERLNKVLGKMNEHQLDVLIIYADLEHGSNFEYLTGFLPRFEEALLVLHKTGNTYLLMGNENLNKAEKARIPATPIHVPHFSLPNQPMSPGSSLFHLIKQARISKNQRIGIVGWKNFTSTCEDNEHLFDIPHYILEIIKDLSGCPQNIINAASLFIGENGVRTTNNVDEIEHYEFGASLASDCMLDAMDLLAPGVSEMELGNVLNAYGQRNSVVTIAAAGERFVKANIYPTQKSVTKGDAISLTVGYKGGLSSRAGYAVHRAEDLPEACRDYLDILVKPYYQAIVQWLENIHCGMPAKELYDLIEQVLPKELYHWHLCPGHLGADEEWLSSPVYRNSKEILKSGMIFQTDIIPSLKGYAGISAESTIVLADKNLRNEIQKERPLLWARMMSRRDYLINTLNIQLNEDVLPMCSTVAYLRPFLFNHEMAMAVENEAIQ